MLEPIAAADRSGALEKQAGCARRRIIQASGIGGCSLREAVQKSVEFIVRRRHVLVLQIGFRLFVRNERLPQAGDRAALGDLHGARFLAKDVGDL